MDVCMLLLPSRPFCLSGRIVLWQSGCIASSRRPETMTAYNSSVKHLPNNNILRAQGVLYVC